VILYWRDKFANKLLQLGVQIFDEDQQLAFGFDVLDDTKFIPEELVPVTPLGIMTLNANPQNYFAETEQIGVSQVNQFRFLFVLTGYLVSTWTRCSRYRLF
jgi:hypothetical protein